MSSAMLPIALLALLPLAAASVKFDGNVPSSVTFDTTFTIKWTSNSKPVKITLNGANNYALVDIVCNEWINNDMSKACTSDKSSIQWTPPSTVPEGRYNLLATDASGNTDSSNFISIAKGNGQSTTIVDSSTSTTAPSSSAAGATSGSNASAGASQSTGAPSSSSSTSSSDASQSTGLSTGAKAGIGIGAAIGGIALLGGLGFLVFRMGKKAAANKDKKKDDGSNGEEGDVAAEDNAGTAAAAGAAAAGARRNSKDEDEKDIGPAEMAAPEFIHEAPDYKLRLDSPGSKEFFSELDATGGSFVLPSSRPSTAAGGIDPNSAFSKKIGGPTDEERPVTPSITVTAPEAEGSGATANTTSPGGKSLDSTAPSETTTAVGSPDKTEGASPVVERAQASEGASSAEPSTSEVTPATPNSESTTKKEETKQ